MHATRQQRWMYGVFLHRKSAFGTNFAKAKALADKHSGAEIRRMPLTAYNETGRSDPYGWDATTFRALSDCIYVSA